MRTAARWGPSRRPEFWIALAVFAAGYGVLTMMWWLGDWRADLPGLYDYRSATLGDGALLPALAAALVALGKRAATAEARWVGIATVLGIVAGAVTQLLWLSDPAPRVNWTLPHPHHFNVAGWWHAGFLVAACGLFSGLWVWALSRIGANERRSGMAATRASLGSFPATVAVASSLALAGLIEIDSSSASQTRAGLTSIVAVGAGLVVLALLAGVTVGYSAVWQARRSWLWAALAAVAICATAARWPPHALQLGALIALIAAAVIGCHRLDGEGRVDP